jgi:hypothetical protein
MAKKSNKASKVTKVLFVKERDPQSILAVFPEQTQGKTKSLVSGYSYLGQHTTVGVPYYKKLPQASRHEYQSLYNELVAHGYELEVINDMAKATAGKSTKIEKPKPRVLVPRDPYNAQEFSGWEEGRNCVRFDYNSTPGVLMFKIYFEKHSETFMGIPYSVMEPLK